MSFSTPVIFLIFRRSDLTSRVFECIRQARPQKLLIIADGPRDTAESVLCQQTRAITEQIDWDCEVLRNYSESNMGCRQRVSTGLDWAFEHVDEAIILEDDCVPHPSFFSYCQELLDRYREDNRVVVISGDNFQRGQIRGKFSYYFSNYSHCWGWATWKRAWHNYDHNLEFWPSFRDGKYLEEILDSDLEIQYWTDIFERLYQFGKPSSWAYVWTFTCWLNRGLTVLPNVNLVSNIGFRDDATHTMNSNNVSNLPVKDIGTLQHPDFIARDRNADMYTFDHHFGGLNSRFHRKVKAKILRLMNYS